ncbi:hypothetical protein V1520DRAFT_313332 [Lipomyces starkeyi]|uniref:Uncharacterized protein n=1 Tax=Lipomyces starkeyi NRRL Y-11557 TaxID=675824 RepID=A0A1E3Q8A9_LIPST|nr:hypothetical protein LIPSTDRAFT_3147 [Lipomyces starkeyi NRRL Y-11557]
MRIGPRVQDGENQGTCPITGSDAFSTEGKKAVWNRRGPSRFTPQSPVPRSAPSRLCEFSTELYTSSLLNQFCLDSSRRQLLYLDLYFDLAFRSVCFAMAEPEQFNSSDQEYEVQRRVHFKAGNASIESMMSARYEDRKTSKKILREQADTGGAPVSVYLRALWLRRLEAYAEMNDISVDEEDGPSGDMLYRFFRTIVNHMKPSDHDKPAIQFRTMKEAVVQLVQGLEFKYPHFKLSRHHAARIDAMLSDLANEGKLLRGRWSKAEWLGTVLFEKMARAWLQTALDQGYLSWNVQISRLLSMSLVVALACRAGEVTVSHGYTTESLTWRHATNVIRFEKGKNFQTNDDRTVFFCAQRDPSKTSSAQSSCCSSKLFEPGTSRTHRHRPVIPAISKRDKAFLELDKPAKYKQLRSSTIQLGLVAGVLAKINTHDWRRGSARDVAHWITKITGVANDATAAALGHTPISTAKGLTDKIPLGAPYKKARLSSDETAKFCLEKATHKNHRQRAGERIRAMRRSERIEEQKNRKVTPETLDDDPQNSTKPLAQRTQSQVNATSVGVASSTQTSRGDGSDRRLSPLKASGNETWKSFIDPQLLLAFGDNSTSLQDAEGIMSSEGDTCVDEGSVNRFMSALSGSLDAAVGEEEAVDRELIRVGLLTENAQSALDRSDMLLRPGDEFVIAFCRINIVRNSLILENSKNAFHRLETRAPSGNTRDPPTLFQYKCINHTNGCTFTIKTKNKLALLLPICDPEKIEKPNPASAITRVVRTTRDLYHKLVLMITLRAFTTGFSRSVTS